MHPLRQDGKCTSTIGAQREIKGDKFLKEGSAVFHGWCCSKIYYCLLTTYYTKPEQNKPKIHTFEFKFNDDGIVTLVSDKIDQGKCSVIDC